MTARRALTEKLPNHTICFGLLCPLLMGAIFLSTFSLSVFLFPFAVFSIDKTDHPGIIAAEQKNIRWRKTELSNCFFKKGKLSTLQHLDNIF